MRGSDIQREENYNEYLRLLQDGDYYGITLDEESGGVSAVHRLHKFDKQIGPFGLRRGDYELKAIEILRKKGYRAILDSERSSQGIKKCDGLLDDTTMEIKAIEGMGTWAISTKLLNADRQHAKCAVLFFPKVEAYSAFRLSEGVRLYSTNPITKACCCLEQIIVIVDSEVVAIWKKSTISVEGWSVCGG